MGLTSTIGGVRARPFVTDGFECVERTARRLGRRRFGDGPVARRDRCWRVGADDGAG